MPSPTSTSGWRSQLSLQQLSKMNNFNLGKSKVMNKLMIWTRIKEIVSSSWSECSSFNSNRRLHTIIVVIKFFKIIKVNDIHYESVACFLSSRTDLLCSPRIAAGEALCLVTHLVSYRGSKNCKTNAWLWHPMEEDRPCQVQQSSPSSLWEV